MKLQFTMKGVMSTPFAFYTNVKRVCFSKDQMIIECLDGFYRVYKVNKIYDLVIEEND